MPSSNHSISGGVASSVAPEDIPATETGLLFNESVEAADKAAAPEIAALLAPDKTRELTVFDPADIQAAKAALEMKNGKPHFKCLATGKMRAAKPEEVVRQLWIARLLNHYHYPKNSLAIEFEIPFGRSNKGRADIVVLDGGRPYIIIEVKAANLKDGKDQLKSYSNTTNAPLAVWSNGGTTSVYHRRVAKDSQKTDHLIEIPDFPTHHQTIEEIIDKPWTLQTLIDEEAAREARGERHKPLRKLIEEMEDEVLSNAGVDVFEEVFKLIFTKLFDEMSQHQGKYPFLRFRNTNTEADLKNKMESLFEEAKGKWEGVFTSGDSIKLSGSHLQVCVGALEKVKLFNSNLDVVDEAFEYLINKSSKGEKGQYFTPRWVIDMCVKMLNPREEETVIDTACGSAGFTVHSIFHVWYRILDELGIPRSHLFTAEKKLPRQIAYVQDKVFAIDFDEKAVRVARCLNLIAGDGETNVLHLNTLDFTRWSEAVGQQAWIDTYNNGWKKLRKLASDKAGYHHFGFDVLMANPPFAGDIKQTDMLSPYDLAHKVDKEGNFGKQENKVGRDLLFVERNLDFLKPGGRMAVVLPQGRFNNSSDKRLREYIADKCRILAVVGIDGNTFKPHTGTKTSVLFVQKWDDELCPKKTDYPIFFATQQVPSKDNSGKPIWAKDPITGAAIKDDHGHYFVQHDLFNHDGKTQDGIAEAFAQFAAKENLSFF